MDFLSRSLLIIEQERMLGNKVGSGRLNYSTVFLFSISKIHSFVNELVRLKIIPDRDIPTGLLF